MRRFAARVCLVAVLTGACSKPADVPAPSPSASAAAAEDPAEALASLTAMTKLVAQEYVLAVDDRGAVTNATELNEADLFADQAKFRYQRLAPQVKAASAEAVRAAGTSIAALGAAVASRKPPAEVQKLALEASGALLALGPAESALTAGLRAAAAQADRNIVAEQGAQDYRVGVFAEPPRRIYRRDAEGVAREVAPPDGAGLFLGVVLREQRTKRFLPDAEVTARFVATDGTAGAPIALAPLWGDYPLYGANVPLPPAGATRLEVHVEPPHHARHGDMLAHVAKPADAAFALSSDGQTIRFAAAAPQPIAGDYKLGDDILQGFGEALATQTVGDYRLGFIAEPPEPFWLWKDGLELKPVKPTDTHHLEVVLQDQNTGLLVPDAAVTLTLTPKAGGAPRVARLHGLLSDFQHYGETLQVEPGDYLVRIDVEPPPTDVLDSPRLLGPARAELDWRAAPVAQGEK